MIKLFKENRFRYWLSMAVALVAGLVVNHFYALTDGYLIPLMAVLAMQTSIGNSFYQGMLRFILILIVICIPALVLYSMHFLYMEMHDAFIGSMIGIAANMLILPRRADAEYRDLVGPIVKAYNVYFQLIITQLLQTSPKGEGNAALEAQLIKLPDWVYARGFDSGLQTSYRYFLIKLEQISEMLFAMHQIARIEYDAALIEKLRVPLQLCAIKITQFFDSIADVFELKKVTEEIEDFGDDIVTLEKHFNEAVPLSLDVLDIKRDYVALTEFIYYLKDLRDDLLRLTEALR
jgi:hypothetical protein